MIRSAIAGSKNIRCKLTAEKPRPAFMHGANGGMVNAHSLREAKMSIARHIEVSAESPKGFEDACHTAIREASETLHGIKQLYIKNVLCEVNDQNQIVNWRVNGKITFVVERQKQ